LRHWTVTALCAQNQTNILPERIAKQSFQEVYCGSFDRKLLQNVSLCKSTTKTVAIQANHFFAALWGYVKLEIIKLNSKLNHLALKSKLYIKALQQSHLEWQSLKSF
jgi:hypothetical protein